MKLVIINGAAESGKDTFVNLCARQAEVVVQSLSTVDMVKSIMQDAGLWDGVGKGERERRLMSDMKDAITRYNDGVFKDITERVEVMSRAYQAASYSIIQAAVDALTLTNQAFMIPAVSEMMPELIVFIHCREPGEIKKLKDHYGDSCVTLLIDAGLRNRKTFDNHADREVRHYPYNVIVGNNETLDVLAEYARRFIGRLVRGEKELKNNA